MKPPAGWYRLSTPGAPSMDAHVLENGTTITTLDTYDYLPGSDLMKARRLSCTMECTGAGTGFAFVGVAPGFAVTLTCTPIQPPPP